MTVHSAFNNHIQTAVNYGSFHNEYVNSCEQNEHLTVLIQY